MSVHNQVLLILANGAPMNSNTVTLLQLGELPCIQVEHPLASALIALQGAQLLRYTPTGSKPVIWLSDTAAYQKGKSVRGGIPICWPWFGDARKNPVEVQRILPQGELPAHGWVRDKPWLLDSVTSDEAGVLLRFIFPDKNALPLPFPKDIELSLEIHIGAELSLCLTTHNGSDQTIQFSQALHSYFAVSNIDQVQVKNLEGVHYIDTLDEWCKKSDAKALSIDQETDRIYLDTPEEIVIADTGWQRELSVRTRHSKSAVVWNPWTEKSKRLSQFEDDAYVGMLCVESANVLGDVALLEARSTTHLQLSIANHT